MKDFINRARAIHGDKYGYASVKYRNIDSKVKIKCPIHGYFDQIAWTHIGRPRSGCSKCGHLLGGQKRKSKNSKTFIRDARKVHGKRYDYSKVVYEGWIKPIRVICPLHGEFWPTPQNHIKLKSRCPKCAKITSSLGVIKKHEKGFVQKAKRIHGDKYDYAKTLAREIAIKIGAAKSFIHLFHSLIRQSQYLPINPTINPEKPNRQACLQEDR